MSVIIKVCLKMCVSVEDLTLNEYHIAQTQHCTNSHPQPCSFCMPMMKAAQMVLEQGIILIVETVQNSFPSCNLPLSASEEEVVANAACGH